jgi:hypothetical protein
MTTRRRVIGLLVLALAGCARSDWIESTLVTVDVTGEWVGTWITTGGGATTLYLNARQSGGKVTGQLTTSGWNAAQYPRSDIVGTLTGDVFRFESGERQFDLVVTADEMRGQANGPRGRGTVEFRRR